MAIALVTSLAVQTSASFGAQIVGPLAPALRADLDLSAGNLALVVSSFYLGATLFLLPSGKITDRVGPRPLFLIGPAIMFFSLWAGSRSDGFFPLLIAMFVAGVGNALSLPSTTRAIMDWFTPQQGRATAMSIKQTGVALAGVIMALVIPVLVVPFGWRTAMFAVGVATLIAGAASAMLYTPGPLVQRVGDGVSAVDLGASESKRLRFQMYAIAAFTFCIAGVQLTFQSFFVLFLRDQMHYPLALAGALLALAQGCGVAARIGWSILSDTLMAQNRRPALAAIAAVALAATVGLALSTSQTAFPLIVVFAVMFGLSAIGWNGIVMVFVTESAGIARAGAAASVNLAASYVAIFVVPPLFGVLVDATHGYGAAFAMLAGLVVLTMLFILPMRETHPATRPAEHAS